MAAALWVSNSAACFSLFLILFICVYYIYSWYLLIQKYHISYFDSFTSLTMLILYLQGGWLLHVERKTNAPNVPEYAYEANNVPEKIILTCGFLQCWWFHKKHFNMVLLRLYEAKMTKSITDMITNVLSSKVLWLKPTVAHRHSDPEKSIILKRHFLWDGWSWLRYVMEFNTHWSVVFKLSLEEVMARRRTGDKSSLQPILTYCQFKQNGTNSKFKIKIIVSFKKINFKISPMFSIEHDT